MDLVRNSAGEPRRKRRGLRLFGLLLAAGVVLGAKAGALPYGAQVSAGQATVTTAGTAMTVRQSTDRAAINWESFSVGQGSSVQFVQPSATSVALNRVVGGDPSVIQGAVTANGRIFLLNPNGILFTAGSQVNVGGIVASTLALSDDDFMAGRFAFAGASSSVIVNQGNITALADGKGGVIAMIAAKVTNDGTLRAEQGSVLLAAGSKVRLDLGGIVGLVVEQGAVDALVANGGAIVAPGGDVLLTAQAAAELASATVNSTGLIEAQTLATGERGRIRLLADMRSGSLAVSGQLDVSAPRGGDGGFVETSAADVGIADSATITALSAHGRTGTWLLDPDVLQVITGGTGTLGSLPATGQSQISPTALSTALTSANVDLQANTYIDFVNAFTYGGARDAVLRLYAPTIKLGADISTSTNKLGLQFGGLFAGNAVTYAGNVFLYDATNPASVTRTLTTKGGAVTFNGDIGANSAAATAYGLTVDASTGGALTHNAPVDGIFTAYNTTTNASVTLSYKPGSVNAQILVDFTTQTVRSNGISIPYTGIMPIGFIRLPAQTINLNAQNSISGTAVKCVMTLTDGTTVTLTPAANGNITTATDLQVTKIAYYTGNASAAAFNATGVTYDTPVQAKPVVDYLAKGGSVTLASGATLAFGGNIAFVASRFVNNAGAYALTPGAAGTWRIWSTNADPFNVSTGDVDGGLLYNYKQYNLAYTGAATGLLGTGNGLIYTYAPNLSVALINTIRKTYDGLTSATNLTASNYAIAGGVGGDAIAFSGATPTNGTYASKNVGTGISVSVTGIASANFSATNRSGLAAVYGYGLPSSTASGNIGIITATPLTITATAASKNYNGLAYAGGNGVTYAGFVNSETSAVLGGALTYAGTSQGAINAGSYALSPAGLTSSNYLINFVSGTLTVSPVALTVTATAASKTYDGLAYAGGNGVTYSGFVNAESASVLGGVVTYGGSAQGALNAGSYAIAPGGLTSSNYAIGYVNGTLTVNKAALTVTANSASKTYDGLAYVGGAGVTYAGFVNGETTAVLSGTVTYGGSAQNAVNAGTYAIAPGGLSAGNYSFTYVAGALAVAKAPLIVTANDDAKLIGTADATNFAGVRYDGLVNGETASVLGGTLAVTRSNPTVNSVGTYADVLVPAGLTASNYSLTYRTGSFTIVAADQLLVKVNDLTNTYGTASTYTVASAAYYSSATGQQVVLSPNVAANGNAIVISDGVGGSASFTLSALNPVLSGALKLSVGVYEIGTTNAVVTSLNFSNNLVFSGRHTVTPRALTVAGLTGVTKTYDGTVTAPIAGLASLTGKLTGDAVGFTSSSALYSSKDVGTGKTIAVAGATLTGADAGNYYLNTIVASGDITKANLTVTAVADAKTYNGLAYAGGNGVAYAGLVNGETAAVLGGTLAYGGTSQGAINVGSYAITPSGLTSGNYAISYANGALTVNKAALTVTASDVTKTYGQAVTLSGYTLSGLQNGETVGGVTLTSSGAVATAGVAGSPYAIVPSAAAGGTFNSANYVIGYVNGALTVNKAALTITATAASKNYNGLAYAGGNGVSYSGFVNAETSTALGGTLSYAGTAQGAINAGTYAITPSGLTSGNYAITFASGALTVSPVALTVTAANDAKTYDGLAYAGGNGVTYAGFVNSETTAVLTGVVSYGGTSQGAKNAGSYVITPSGLSSGNYTISYASGTLTVNKAALTVKANDDAKLSGNLDNSPAYAGVSYTGLVNGETGSALGGTLTIARTNAGTETAGTYAGVLVPSGLTSANYNLTYQNGSYTIIGTSQLLVQLDNLTTTYGTSPTYSVASVSYYKSGGSGTQVYLNGSVAASGNNITVTDGAYVTTFTLATVSPLYGTSGSLRVGVYGVDATSKVIGTGEPNFNSIFVTGAHTVIQKPLTLTGLTGINKTYDGTKAANISGVGLSGVIGSDVVSLAYSSAQYDSKDVGQTRTILVADAALSGTDAANYTFSTFTATGDITPAPLTVTAANASKTYNAATYADGAGVAYSGLVNGETSAVLSGTVAYGGTSQGAVDAGSYAITPSGLTSANYAITYADGTLTVNKAGLTVTAAAAAKVYDGQAYAGGNGVTYAGFIAGQGAAYLTGSLTYVGDAQGATNAGSYVITPSGLSAANYDITYVSGALTIAKAYLTASVVVASKTYDGHAYSGGNGLTYSGFVNSETSSVLAGSIVYGGVAQGATNAGSYALTASGKTSANYDISYVPGILTVGKAALTATAVDVAKTYDGSLYAGGGGVSYGGFVNSETSSVLGGSLTYVGTSQSAKDVGTYGITPTGLTAANYAITYVAGTLTINKASLVVTAAADTKAYDGLAHSGGNGLTYAGFVNNETELVIGGTVSYTGTSQGAIGVGTYGITPAGLTATNYDIQFASGSLTVTPAALRVVATAASKAYDGLAYAGGNGVTYVGFVNGETTSVLSGTLAYGGSSQGAINAGSYAITPSGQTATNYTLSFENGALSVNKAPVTITPADVTKTYGQTATLSSYAISGLQNSETVGSVTLTSSGTVATAGVGSSPYAITASNATGGTFSSANYDITYAAGSLTVNKAALTITASDVAKTYGQAPTLSAFTSSGLQNSETVGSVTLTSAGTVATAGVGSSPYAITASNATGGTFSAANYDITYAAGSLTVNKAALTITATDVAKTYGQAPTLSAFTSSGFQNSETVGSVTLTSAGTVATAGVGSSPYTITASSATGGTFSSANYDITYTAGSLTVNKAALTITASDVAKTYGQAPTLSAFTSSGLQNSETVGSVTLVSSGTVATAGVGSSPYTITASSATGGTFSSANYDITYTAGSLTVNKAALTITASDVAKTYGQAPTLSAFTSSGLQNSETVGSVTLVSSGTVATAGVGSSPYAITASNATGGTFSSANYDITYAAGSLTVNKAALTITASDVAKTYGQAPTLSGYTTSGLQNSETVGSVTLTSSGTVATAGVGSSPYAITASNATGGTFSSANYDITYAAGSLTVGKAALTITASDVSKTYGQAPTLTAFTFSGLQNSETVGSVTLTSSGTVATAGVGSSPYVITASNATGGTFDPANYTVTYAAGSLTVGKAALTFTASDVAKTYGQAPTLSAFTSAGLQNSETVGSVTLTSSGTVATAGVGSSPYAITASNATGGTFSSANYDITYAAGSLTVNKAALTITASDVAKTYGQAPTLSGYTTSGLQNSETVGSVTLTSSGTVATAGVGSSPYAITASNATGGTFSSANYDITYAAGSLTVSKATLTVTPGATKTYDGQPFSGGAVTYSGFVNSETASALSGSLTYGGAAQGAVNANTYTLTVSGQNSANYDIVYAPGSLVIGRAALMITATDVTKTYGQTPTLSAFTSSGLQNSETVGGVTLASSGTVATAGVGSSPYAITASNATGGTFDAANYDITYAAGSLTVGKAALTITASDVAKTYGQAPTLSAYTTSGLQNSETVGGVTLTSSGTVATAGVGSSPYAITASNATGGTFDPANYTVTYAAGSLTVGKAALTITASDVAKTYGQAPTLSAFTSAGLQNSETVGSVTLTSSGTVATAGVGSSPYAITASNATGGTFSSANYDITYAAGSLTVNKAALTITASDVAKTYGQAPTLSGYTTSGLQNSETVGSVTLTSSGTVATAGVGSSPYAITASNATGGTFSSANYDITYAAGSLTVSKATLTVTPGATKTYDGQPFSGGAVTYSGFVNSETASALSGSLTYGGAAQGAVNANTYTLTVSGQNSANYDIVYAPGSLVIGRAALMITATDVTKTYGQTPTLSAFTSSGLQNSETVGGVTLASSGTVATAGVGSSPYAITAANATGGTFDSANYDITYAAGALTVGKATLTVTPGATKTYDGQPYSGGAVTYSGFVNAETPAALSGSLTYGGAAQGAVNANTYTLTVSGQNSANYDIVYAPGSLLINKAAMTITASDVTKTYGQTPTLSAFTSSGLQNGETIGGVALTSPGVLVTAGVGSSPYAITASNATGGTFDVANYDITYVDGSLTVSKATLTVTPGATKTYDGQAYSGGAVTYSGFVNSESESALSGSLTYGGTALGAKNANTYTLTAGGQNSANYDIVYAPGSLVINKAGLTITATDVSKTYGQAPMLTAFTSAGLQNSETIGSVTLASSGTVATAGVGASPYAITASNATGGTFDAANYDITYAAGSLTVGKAALTITASDVSKTYGQAPTLSAYTTSGLQNSETVGSVTLASSGTVATAGVGSSPYAISVSGATGGTFSSANYDITYTAGSLTVGKAALTITASDVAKTYGQTPTLSAFTSAGLQNSETIGGVTLASSGTSAAAGVGSSPYAITASNATGGTFDVANYDITYAAGALTIGKATLTVTPGATKTYDGQAYSGGAATYSGFVNSESESALSGSLTYGGTAQGAKNANTYTLTVSGQTSANYDIVYAPGSLVINKAGLTITADNVSKTYGQTPILSAFASAGLQNSETVGGVTLTSSGTVATAGVGASPYAITASNATGGTFAASNYDIRYVAGALTVNKATLTVTPGATKTYDGNPFTGGSVSYAGFMNSETPSVLAGSLVYGGAAQGAIGANTYTLTAGGQSSANYDIVYAPGSLVVGKAGLTVTSLAASKVQDGGAYFGGAGVAYVGFVAGQGASQLGGLLAYGGTSQGAVTAGTYSIMPMGLTSPNYQITFLAGLLTISPGGETVDPIPYLLPPVKPKPFLVFTQPIAPSSPVGLGVGGLNYVHVDNLAAVKAGATPAATSVAGVPDGSEGETTAVDSGGPIDATALPRSIKGPTDVFIIKGGLNVGKGALLTE